LYGSFCSRIVRNGTISNIFTIFEKNIDMYTLKEAWGKLYGADPIKNWQGKIHCILNNREIVIKSNSTRGYISAYAYNLVTKGWIIARYGKRDIRFENGDINIYSPGLDQTVVECSDIRGQTHQQS